MPYAIVGYFDKYSDDKIRSLWKGMEETGIDDYLIHSNNNPHFKFAMYEDLNITKAEQELRSITSTTRKLPIQFKSYSFYPNEKPFLCIDIAVYPAILELQAQIRSNCDPHARLFNINYFDQGIWKPDCQLTIEFEKEKLVKAIDFLSNTVLPFSGMLDRIGIIEFHPAKQLFSYELAL